MQDEVWQRLIRLESHDLVANLFERFHGRTLSSTRTAEIRSAVRQGREYFRQASTANQAVRPLLTFYGVASLSRALALLLRRDSGENSLKKGHGIKTCSWSATLTSDVGASLPQIGSLRIHTCGGLFSDLMDDTRNRICMHIRSSAVDWRLEYKPPPSGIELSIGDLLERLPDLKSELLQMNAPARFVQIGEMSFTNEVGFSGALSEIAPGNLRRSYEEVGYTFTADGQHERITADPGRFSSAVPQFYHAYIQKIFGKIPRLYLVEPFESALQMSQIGMTYLVSYVLGMLARYFPTHWIALLDGGRGDRLWPALYCAQHYVETAYPELIDEFIDDVIANPLPHRASA